MLTVVVYEKKTRKVIFVLPIMFDTDTSVKQQEAILHNDFDFEVFINSSPVFYEDARGYVCLKDNTFMIESSDL